MPWLKYECYSLTPLCLLYEYKLPVLTDSSKFFASSNATFGISAFPSSEPESFSPFIDTTYSLRSLNVLYSLGRIKSKFK